MEIHHWIIGQIITDTLIAGLLVWFVIFHFRMKRHDNGPMESYGKAEQILSKITELSLQLEKSLGEKTRISRNILKQLDESLQKAEESLDQINKIMAGSGPKSQCLSQISDPGRLRSSISTLLVKGLSREEIARNLGISQGELELLIKLQPESHISNSYNKS